MPPHDPIDQWIAAALARSGLPMEKRADTAREWRDHLDQSIQDRCAQGMTREQAVHSALCGFGDPGVLRRTLRRTQTSLDRRATLRDVCGHWRIFTVAPAVFVALLAMLFDRPSLWHGAAAGIAFIAWGSLPMALCMYAVVRARTVILRERPRQEFILSYRCAMWMALILGTLVVSVLVSGILITVASPMLLWFDAGRNSPDFLRCFLFYYQSDLLGTAIDRGGLILTVLICSLLSAVMLSVLERSRCIDTESVAADR